MNPSVYNNPIKVCPDCKLTVQDFNKYFYRCPNCAKIYKKQGEKVESMSKLVFIGLMPLLLLLVPHNAFAWYDNGPPGPIGDYGPDNCCQPVCGGYCAGQQDATYDIQNNIAYNPVGQCLPCHGPDYWNNFRQGYDSYWNQHQEQSQGSSINIYGNNNYVSTNQYATQNPLQQLAHLACGVLNCQGLGQGQGLGQPTAYNQNGGYDYPGPG